MPIVLPMPPAPAITPADAGRIAGRARKLLRRGLLTHRQAVLLDCLLWSCRRPGQGAVVASLTALARLTHMSRETVVQGLRRLAELGLIQIIKRRVRVAWIGARFASRQATSAYVFRAPDTESGPATVIQGIEISLPLPTAAADARAALEAVRHRRAGCIAALLGRRAAPVPA